MTRFISKQPSLETPLWLTSITYEQSPGQRSPSCWSCLSPILCSPDTVRHISCLCRCSVSPARVSLSLSHCVQLSSLCSTHCGHVSMVSFGIIYCCTSLERPLSDTKRFRLFIFSFFLFMTYHYQYLVWYFIYVILEY